MNSLNNVPKHIFNNRLELLIMGIGHPPPFWIFIHDTERVEGGLMLLFFYLVFPAVPPGNFSADAPAADY